MKSETPIDGRVVTFAGWRRLTAYLCLLLIGFASYVQVSHDHGARRGHARAALEVKASLQGDSSSEADCPVCAAMSGAAPSLAWSLQTSQLVDSHESVSIRQDRVRQSLWPYATFGRPPPSLS